MMLLALMSMSIRASRIIKACTAAIILAFTSLPSTAKAELDNDVRLWQTLGINFYEDADWRVTAHGQTRFFDEGKFLGAWLLFPTLEYKLHANLDIGATYLLEDIRSDCGRDYDRLHIFWLHASPHWKLNEDWQFKMRHVLGRRAIESQRDYWMSRHLFSINYKVEDAWRLVGLSANTELFYRYDDNRLFENRFIPVKATFKLNEKTKLSLFVMAQSRRYGRCSSWETGYVFGQSLSYKW